MWLSRKNVGLNRGCVESADRGVQPGFLFIDRIDNAVILQALHLRRPTRLRSSCEPPLNSDFEAGTLVTGIATDAM